MMPLAQVLAAANRPAPAPPQATVAPTNVAGIFANHDAQALDKYKTDIGQQNAQFGALASLGAAGINAFAPGLGTALQVAGKAALAPGATGPGIGDSSYSIGYGGRNVPVYGQ